MPNMNCVYICWGNENAMRRKSFSWLHSTQLERKQEDENTQLENLCAMTHPHRSFIIILDAIARSINCHLIEDSSTATFEHYIFYFKWCIRWHGSEIYICMHAQLCVFCDSELYYRKWNKLWINSIMKRI